MKLKEIGFSEYYHGYLVIEADELTESLQMIHIHDDDCYTLCSCYVNDDGASRFNVLGVSRYSDRDFRGLHFVKMLGEYSYEEVAEREAFIVEEPEAAAVKKNERYLFAIEQQVSAELYDTRNDARLDHLRQGGFPDTVTVSMATERLFVESPMKIVGIHGPCLVGEFMTHKVLAMPALYGNQLILLAVTTEEDLQREDNRHWRQLIDYMDQHGMRFTGPNMRS